LFLQAGIDFDIDLGNSINLGDKRSDVEAGLNAGVKNNILLHNGLDPFDESSGFRIICSFEELIGRNDDLEHSTTHHC
jgi:histidinol phosphatase-like enzyme